MLCNVDCLLNDVNNGVIEGVLPFHVVQHDSFGEGGLALPVDGDLKLTM